MKTTNKLILPFFQCLFVFSKICLGQDNYTTNIRTTVSDEQKLFINYDIVVNDGSKYLHVIPELMYMGETVIPNPNN